MTAHQQWGYGRLWGHATIGDCIGGGKQSTCLGPSRGRRDVTPLNTPSPPTSEANTAEKAQKLATAQRGAVQKLIKPSLKAAVST